MNSPRFKELCLDVTAGAADSAAVGRFWAAATGCSYVPGATAADPGDVVGPVEGMGIALCGVPEPKTVKNRVHLDLHLARIEEVTGLGAQVLRAPDAEISWTVLADPAGNEFCGFLRDPATLGTYRAGELVVDCRDVVAITAWWAEVFGVPVRSEDGTAWRWLTGVDGFEMGAWVFNPVPDPKTVKNRLHWDLYGDPDAFEARGATRLWEMPRWTVFADPEGNEFCVFPDPPA